MKNCDDDEMRILEEIIANAKDGDDTAMCELAIRYGDGCDGLKQNIDKSIELLNKSIANGSARAMSILGAYYYEGKGVEKDIVKSNTLTQKAADLGDPQGIYNLGLSYYWGEGFKKDVKKGLELIKKSADLGFVEAVSKMASMYFYGDDFEKDINKAIELWKQAADLGDTNSMVNLAICYRDGDVLEKDFSRTIELFKQAADLGSTDALCELGNYYLVGKGVEKDPQKGFALLKRSADAGDARGMTNLGICYLRGEGVDKNLEEAFKCFSKAADNGDTAALVNLGLCYSDGLGVGKNLKKAFELYERAAKDGDPEAIYNLGVCYQEGEGTEIDQVKAFEMYKASADQVKSAGINLANCYMNGYGVERDEEKAFEMFSKLAGDGDDYSQNLLAELEAEHWRPSPKLTEEEQRKAVVGKLILDAQSGDSDAEYILGCAYQKGEVFPQDIDMAMKWWERATKQENEFAKEAIANAKSPKAGKTKAMDDSMLDAVSCRFSLNTGSATIPTCSIRVDKNSTEKASKRAVIGYYSLYIDFDNDASKEIKFPTLASKCIYLFFLLTNYKFGLNLDLFSNKDAQSVLHKVYDLAFWINDWDEFINDLIYKENFFSQSFADANRAISDGISPYIDENRWLYPITKRIWDDDKRKRTRILRLPKSRIKLPNELMDLVDSLPEKNEFRKIPIVIRRLVTVATRSALVE
jgi:TPR repeat protein